MPKLYLLTKNGAEKIRRDIKILEKRLKSTLAQKGGAFETGGDGWHDNFSFEQLVREEQRLIFEINHLKDFLKNSRIVQEKTGRKTAGIGSRVLVSVDRKRKELKIVGFGESEPDKNLISYDSALGAAIFGKRRGTKKEIITAGKKKVIEILNIN